MLKMFKCYRNVNWMSMFYLPPCLVQVSEIPFSKRRQRQFQLRHTQNGNESKLSQGYR